MNGQKRNVDKHMYCWLCVYEQEGAISKGQHSVHLFVKQDR